jgi:hypothetical protein
MAFQSPVQMCRPSRPNESKECDSRVKLHWRTTTCAIGVLGLLAACQGVTAAAATGQRAAAAAVADHHGTSTCTGTLTSPGELTGRYANLVINGACAVQSGPVRVDGNVIVEPNGILNADFAADGSQISIGGNLFVLQNASVLMGCDVIPVTIWATTTPPPLTLPSFPCFDDPNPSAPTLSSHDTIGGNVIADQALGVVFNNDAVGGSIIENGGGGGPSCAPSGVFGQDVGFPPYSTFADTTVGGSVVVTQLDTCFFGMFRVKVGGSVINKGITNSDPDGMEDATNVIHGNFVCLDNTPAIQFGDSDGFPNKVGGFAVGQCAFGLTALNPSPEAGVTGFTPVPQPISVPLRGHGDHGHHG